MLASNRRCKKRLTPWKSALGWRRVLGLNIAMAVVVITFQRLALYVSRPCPWQLLDPSLLERETNYLNDNLNPRLPLA